MTPQLEMAQLKGLTLKPMHFPTQYTILTTRGKGVAGVQSSFVYYYSIVIKGRNTWDLE